MASIRPLLMAFVAIPTAHAHMLMNTPTPFSPDKAMTWPVEAPGGRFPYPCQGMTDVAFRTVVTAGSTTLVNFTGSAPHGGGSCQFGINYLGLPAYTANPADWKTIYTIIGGCPAEIVSTAGNLEEPPYFRGYGPRQIPDAVHCGDDKGVDCIRQFEIPIPKDLPNGDATMAWTWYNRITKDELYMMCAPITVVGGVEDAEEGRKFVEELPVMFLANIPGFANCTTSRDGEHGVFNIPNPGRYGVQLIEPDPRAAGNCPVAPPAVFEGQGGSEDASASTLPSSSPSTSSSDPCTCTPAAPSSSTVTSSASTTRSARHTSTRIVTVTGGMSTVTKTVDAPSSARRTTTCIVTVTQGMGTVTITVDPPTTTATERKTPAAAGPYPCTENGSVVCIEEYWFGLCNTGVAYPTPLADSFVCKDGKVQLRPGL